METGNITSFPKRCHMFFYDIISLATQLHTGVLRLVSPLPGSVFVFGKNAGSVFRIPVEERKKLCRSNGAGAFRVWPPAAHFFV